MLKAILIVCGMLGGVAANAGVTLGEELLQQQHRAILKQVGVQNLNWKVGDENNYKIDMGFIQGTMVMRVREIGNDGIWMDQLVDLGFAGKQTINILLDPVTGEIKKMIVNGKEQQPPKTDIEVLEMKEDKITVPAGTYDCIHARILDRTNNQEINTWMNPRLIPLSGMLKTIQPSQFGQVTILLTSFKKN